MARKLAARVRSSAFGLDVARLRRGDFTDRYFLNIRRIFESLSRRKTVYPEKSSRPAARHEPAEAWVEMRFFTRRAPFSIACGIEHARAILESAAGSFDGRKRWRPARGLAAWAVPEGSRLSPLSPALVIRGRYREFCILETPILGVLARETRVATNVHRALEAARGKPVFFFPARMDLSATQSSDGWAYRVAVETYRKETGRKLPVLISTREQGRRWGGGASGTVAHAYILCFLGDTAEAMIRYAESLPLEVSRIALVDTTGDCVGESLRTARAFFQRHQAALRAGNDEQARRFVLHGVRADTAFDVRDRSVPATGDPRRDCGVNERLVKAIRRALDAEPARSERGGDGAIARRFFHGIKIVVTGGFDPGRIEQLERARAPVDIYGVGSWFLRGEPNDFTGDVVRVRLGRRWVRMAKVGRGLVPNPALRRLL